MDKEGNEITLIDVLGTAPDVVGEAVENQCDIAKLLGISRSYVSRIEKRAIGKLGKNLSAEDN